MGDTYVGLFINSALAKGDPTSALMLVLLFLGRILPIIALSPFFGARVLPHPVKVCLALSLFVIFLPKLLQMTTTQNIGFNPWALALLSKEVFIGYLLGFLISLPFQIVQTAGMMIDHQRGGASLMVNDPTLQNQSSPIALLFNMITIVVFFYIDGPFLFIEAISTSYEVVPPDQLINSNFFNENSPLWKIELSIFKEVMDISIRLASPGLLAILMTDLFLGIVNRMAPQVQITFLGMPLKSLLALAVIALGWKAFSDELAVLCSFWLNQVTELLVVLKSGTV